MHLYICNIYILYYNLNLSYISIYRPWNFNEIHGYIRLVIESHASSSCNDLFLVIWCDWLWLPDYLGILWALGIANVRIAITSVISELGLKQNWPAVWSGGIRRTPLMHETSIEELCQKYQQTSDTARFIAHQTTALAIVIIVIIYLNIFVIIVHMFPRVPSATSFRVRCAQPTSSGFLTQHSAKRS